MNTDLLKALDALVEKGSISLAAQKLHKTQPAISMALKKLESEVGFTIFNRQGYRLQLTEQGNIYYQKSKAILEQVAELHNLSQSFNLGEEYKVVLAIESVVDQLNVLQKLRPVQQKYKNTELHIKGVNLLHGLSHLETDEADMAITPWLPTFSSEGNFTTKVIGNFSFSLCGHKSLFEPFNITNAEQINESILKQLPQITPSQIALNLTNTDFLKHIGCSLIKIDDMYGFLAALKAKLGWGPVPVFEWDTQWQNDFYKFSIADDMNDWLGEIRVVKLKSKVLGPVSQMIWDLL